MHPTQDRAWIVAARLRHALSAAGLPPEGVDTSVQLSPQAITVRLLPADGGDVTLEQLATIAAVLRTTEPGGRLITASVA